MYNIVFFDEKFIQNVLCQKIKYFTEAAPAN